MTNQSTIDKLIEMRMVSMADQFRLQLDDPSVNDMNFEDRFALMVDVEYIYRKNERVKRLIRRSGIEQTEASIANIDYHSGRKLNRELIERLAACEYILDSKNIFITGATGCGKTYLACAFGMEACKQFYTVKFVRLPDLFLDLKTAKDIGKLDETRKKYTRPRLLILDEWLLNRLDEEEAKELLEIIQRRRSKSATIFCSQYREGEWYRQICPSGHSVVADGIIDRIRYDSYKIDIESLDPSKDISMRQIYGLDQTQVR